MTARVRFALLALLIVGGVAVLRTTDAAPAAPREPAPPMPGDVNNAVAWLMVIATPLLALLIYAAIAHRPQHRPAAGDNWRRPRWGAALVALAALLLISIGLALLAHIIRRGDTRPSTSGSTPGTTRPPGEEPVRAPPSPRGQGGDVDFELWSLFVLGALAALILTAVITRRTTTPPPQPEPEPEPGAPSRKPPLEAAARAALSTVDKPAGDPRAAIIRCYAAMEEALTESPGAIPEPADTPSDVLRRATDAGRIRTESGTRLVSLFEEARYSSHPMTEDHRVSAVETLRAILDDLRRPAAWTSS